MTITTPAKDVPTRARKSLRVLYADDMRELRHLLEIVLGRDGHKVDLVADGHLAFDLVQKNPTIYDVVITDHHMPEMNGLELVRLLHTTRYAGKVMVFSSELDPLVHREYHQLGVPVILPKPIRPSVLRKALVDLLPAAHPGPA